MDTRSILACVMSCDACTSMANAFRRALGLPLRWQPSKRGAIVSADAYADLAECFANRESPMDWR